MNVLSDRVNPEQVGSKVAAHLQVIVPPDGTFTVRVRFSPVPNKDPLGDFDAVFQQRIAEAAAINHLSGTSVSLWYPEHGSYDDILHLLDRSFVPLKVRSFVGLIPLFAVETLEPDLLGKLPRFRRHMAWFIKHRPKLVHNVCPLTRADGSPSLPISSKTAVESSRQPFSSKGREIVVRKGLN